MIAAIWSTSIPVEGSSQEYIISSHVFEHVPNPLRALAEVNQVLVDGGIHFMIVPQRDALKSDAKRPLTTWEQWETAFEREVTVETWDSVFPNDSVERRGHYFVYTPDSLTDLIARACEYLGINLGLVAREDVDTKVGNGFTLVYRVYKVAQGGYTIEAGDDAQFAYLKESVLSRDEAEKLLGQEVPDAGDLAEAIANPVELDFPEDTPRPKLEQTQDDPPAKIVKKRQPRKSK